MEQIVGAIVQAPAALARYLIRGYKLLISPFMPPACRFQPTCSDYASEAIGRFGLLRGGWLALRRLARCQPWGGSGYDPVPLRTACGGVHPHPPSA